MRRYTDLVAKNATTVVTLNNAQTQVNVSRALAESNKATLEGLKVQLSYCTIRAPISGRISMASVKVGNIVRQADTTPLATINQVAPIYVSFTVPQRNLPDVRAAIAAETATLEAVVPGSGRARNRPGHHGREHGRSRHRHGHHPRHHAEREGSAVAGHPGQHRADACAPRTRITIPATALQLSQAGSFVFVVKDNTATVRPVKIERTVDGVSVVESGLEEGDVVVTDGQLLLSNGTKVTIRTGKAES